MSRNCSALSPVQWSIRLPVYPIHSPPWPSEQTDCTTEPRDRSSTSKSLRFTRFKPPPLVATHREPSRSTTTDITELCDNPSSLPIRVALPSASNQYTPSP